MIVAFKIEVDIQLSQQKQTVNEFSLQWHILNAIHKETGTHMEAMYINDIEIKEIEI